MLVMLPLPSIELNVTVAEIAVGACQEAPSMLKVLRSYVPAELPTNQCPCSLCYLMIITTITYEAILMLYIHRYVMIDMTDTIYDMIDR